MWSPQNQGQAGAPQNQGQAGMWAVGPNQMGQSASGRHNPGHAGGGQPGDAGGGQQGLGRLGAGHAAQPRLGGTPQQSNQSGQQANAQFGQGQQGAAQRGQSQYGHAQGPQWDAQYGQVGYGAAQFGSGGPADSQYGQRQRGEGRYGQGEGQYGQGEGRYGQAEGPYGVWEEGLEYGVTSSRRRLPPGDGPGDGGGGSGRSDRPRLVGALALVVVAVLTTVLSVNWIWTKADAVTPVDLPSAKGTPLKTINPSVKPTPTPPPTGKVVGSKMIAFNNDTMPMMSSAWSDNGENTGLLGGAASWLTVHKNYDGKTATWGNYVAFGGLNKKIPWVNTPAGRKEAAVQAASNAIVRLYDKDVKIIGKATHRAITVDGHPGHELTAKVEIKVPKLKETFSTVVVAVIDRGDGTADVAIADIAGSTPQWLPVWRTKVSQIEFSN
ncbi:hypothetical protein EV643_1185 [Kribbella sp. VKM Ac-2527]|uniref:Uncharacterized protein n=1 Tax=Kribbella caucasensis TaxID=2512215 RepID=A0A4R6K234_9ACTN|nr:hypothetical protein [Kribbella sp. VKM Ac-2527]TDO43264.1 hypothetical protein EV643_1185 [Kribbella sp. VKM Ac-2527]